mmetsp:Transcript_3970/g.8615  ORF Transcript_3970/g.8615 Transcript_3970/m.8615 type:complete len:161 (+) Transcript_3970:108-590(+)
MNLLRSFLLAVAVAATSVGAFSVLPNGPATGRPATSLSVFGPKQALAIERTKNPAKFEQTIQGLMSSKGLTRGQAEKRYGEFLVDPDGFALKAAEEERREKGYKDWIEQAVAKSDDPDATRKRIDDFTKRNQLKGTAIMIAFSAAVLSYSTMNPYISPGP